MNRTKREACSAVPLGVSDPGMLPNQAPIERLTVGDQVVQRIIALVKSGNLRAGDKLPSEVELATAFSISRPSVREGLKMLRVLGVTETRQGGRYYITDLSTSRLIEPIQYIVFLQDYDVGAHLEARIAVDLALTRLACERATDADVHKVQSLASAGHQFTHDAVGFRLLDVEFHQTLNEAARSPMLARLSRSLYELGFEFRRIATEMPGVIEKSVADHDLIARAVAARKPELAEKAFRRHLENVRKTTVDAQTVVENRRRQRSERQADEPVDPVLTATDKASRKTKKR